VTTYARALLHDSAVQRHLDAWMVAHEPSVQANILSQKLVQLTMPGVPDVYQGCEIVMLSLVDPDNRRPVDWTDRGERLERVLSDEPSFDLDDEKLRVTARALRVRRDDAAAFVGDGTTYAALATTSEHALAFARGDAEGARVVTVATRAAGRLAAAGGFADTTVSLPEGRWRDVLSDGDAVLSGPQVLLADLLAHRPVALLVRQP
jgi:(1->4)-alpha-D-glucan 1-alpha-D-glucosylmutase